MHSCGLLGCGQGRVSYIKASVMREHDLERLAADEAKAAFILSDWCVRACVHQYTHT